MKFSGVDKVSVIVGGVWTLPSLAEVYNKIKKIRGNGFTILLEEQNDRKGFPTADRSHVNLYGKTVLESSSPHRL
jgi:ABC-type branched-subunit amino acid transport system ATPase component